MLPSEELSICFAPVAFRLHERFSTLGTGIISLVAEVRAARAFSPPHVLIGGGETDANQYSRRLGALLDDLVVVP